MYVRGYLQGSEHGRVVTIVSNLCQRLKGSPVFSDHVIVKLSRDQTGSSQNGGLTTCGFAFSMNTAVKRLKIECSVCNTPNNTILYPELSFLLRYTPSLSTPILQDFCKI